MRTISGLISRLGKIDLDTEHCEHDRLRACSLLLFFQVLSRFSFVFNDKNQFFSPIFLCWFSIDI